MSDAAIERLIQTEQQMRGAMEVGDPRKIEEAMTAFLAAIEAVRGIGAWRPDEALKTTLQNLRAHLESDQKLARVLADFNQQKLDVLANKATPQSIARATYTRRG